MNTLLAGVLHTACTGNPLPADSDGDTDPPPPLDGLLTMTWTADDQLICDIDVAFWGTGPYVGDCHACDFQFEVDSQVVRDDSPGTTNDAVQILPDCREYTYTWLEQPGPTDFGDAWFTRRWIGFSAAYATERIDGTWVNATNTLWAGAIDDFDHLRMFASHRAYYDVDGTIFDEKELGIGTAAFAGDTLWFDGQLVTYGDPEKYVLPASECGPAFFGQRAATHANEQVVVGRVPCGSYVPEGGGMDVWTFDVAAGADVAVTIDLPGPDGVNIGVGVVGPDQCMIHGADTGLRCTSWTGFDDGNSSCDSNTCGGWTGTIPADRAGTYSALVGATNCCAGLDQQRGTYALGVSGATEGTLRLAFDDVPFRTRYELRVVGSATLTPDAVP